ncbi:MAG: 3-hydroxyacyl-CoA dehydrogenase NAD-binding domain-containing protein [Flavobacteriales bacterium]
MKTGTIGIVGAGAMGSGIAQVAAQSGHHVIVTDMQETALQKSKQNLASTLGKLVEKGKMTKAEAGGIDDCISYNTSHAVLSDCKLVIEAIVENLDVKKKVFSEVETIVNDDCVLASNTSSLSITAIAAACKKPERVIGIHFFNPAPVMPLVEIIPALQTDIALSEAIKTLMTEWKKVPVIAKDTPGFIVNRVARPFYGEALRIYEEGYADFATIDAAMRDLGFKMGPFELMDLIGNDVNYAVTESAFTAFYFDPRYKPSITQKRNVEAGWYGKKSGRGFYNYAEGAVIPSPSNDTQLRDDIGKRILAMLINEAYEALHLNIASAEDLDTAMTKGVNYPKGLIAWGKEIGLATCADRMSSLYLTYQEDRYRCSLGLRG